MNETTTEFRQRGTWAGTCSLLSIHLITFGMLYLVLVQMNFAFRDFFSVVGTNPTRRFEFASAISDIIAAFTPVVVLALGTHLFVVFRLARRANRWTSAYSHVTLVSMGAIAFLWTAWAVHAMTWGKPGIANPNVVATAERDADQLAIATVSRDK